MFIKHFFSLIYLREIQLSIVFRLDFYIFEINNYKFIYNHNYNRKIKKILYENERRKRSLKAVNNAYI